MKWICTLNCNDFTTHLFCDCKTMASNREHFWDYVAKAHGIELEVELFNKSDNDFVTCLLGGKIAYFEKRQNDHLYFLKTCSLILICIVLHLLLKCDLYCIYIIICLKDIFFLYTCL